MAGSRIKCSACDGRGERAKINWGLAIVTLGVGIILDLGMPDACKVCDGRGYLVRDKGCKDNDTGGTVEVD